ncbi:Uncharacterised protein [Sphingobacterium daejeonense]|jgi:hypothetical protein|nr:Uncharacterised protein [Sphingobacterium daejeonense]
MQNYLYLMNNNPFYLLSAQKDWIANQKRSDVKQTTDKKLCID